MNNITVNSLITILNYLPDYDLFQFSVTNKHHHQICQSKKLLNLRILKYFGPLTEDKSYQEHKIAYLKNNDIGTFWTPEKVDIGIMVSYRFRPMDMAELATKGYWQQIGQMSNYMNQLKTNLYFVTNRYDDFLRMLKNGYEPDNEVWYCLDKGNRGWFDLGHLGPIRSCGHYEDIVKLCFANGIYPNASDIFNSEDWFEDCGYHKSVDDNFSYQGNYYVHGYENSYDCLMDNKQYDDMGEHLFDHLYGGQDFSYYSLDLTTIEFYLKEGIKPIQCLNDLARDYRYTQMSNIDYDNYILSHLKTLAKYKVGIPRNVAQTLADGALVTSYNYFIETFLSVIRLPDGTLEQRKVLDSPKLNVLPL